MRKSAWRARWLRAILAAFVTGVSLLSWFAYQDPALVQQFASQIWACF